MDLSESLRRPESDHGLGHPDRGIPCFIMDDLFPRAVEQTVEHFAPVDRDFEELLAVVLLKH